MNLFIENIMFKNKMNDILDKLFELKDEYGVEFSIQVLDENKDCLINMGEDMSIRNMILHIENYNRLLNQRLYIENLHLNNNIVVKVVDKMHHTSLQNGLFYLVREIIKTDVGTKYTLHGFSGEYESECFELKQDNYLQLN